MIYRCFSHCTKCNYCNSNVEMFGKDKTQEFNKHKFHLFQPGEPEMTAHICVGSRGHFQDQRKGPSKCIGNNNIMNGDEMTICSKHFRVPSLALVLPTFGGGVYVDPLK